MNYHGSNLSAATRRLQTNKVVMGEVQYEPWGECGPRIQRDYELVVLDSGRCHVEVDGVGKDLKAGFIYLFLPGRREYFRFAADRPTQHTYCSVRPTEMPKIFARMLNNAVASVPCSELFRTVLAQAIRLPFPADEWAGQVLEQLSFSLFAEYINISQQSGHETPSDWGISRFLEYVHNHFGETDCLLQAHRAAGISRNGLITKFRAKRHSTPSRYLWQVRVQRGAAMLYETGYTIEEIAYRCGFKSQFHFSRMIKTHFGVSPRLMRKQS